MSEFRHGRRRFISRDPLREERWNTEHEHNRARRSTHGRNAGTAVTQSNVSHWSTSDPSSTHVTGFSSSLHPHPSSSPPPSRRRAADCYTFRLPIDHNNGFANPAARSRDRSVLRSAVTTKTKLCATNERRMTEEIGFRPIYRRGSESNSSSENEHASQKDLSSSTSKTKKPCSIGPVSQDIQPMNPAGSHSGTFLTLPANADSMHVQIQDTKISITRIHDAHSQDSAARRISAEYDNCPELENVSVKAGDPVSSTKIFPVPAASVFRTSDYQPTQRSPVRGLRLVPSPNSAFTKTRPTTKASEEPEKIQLQSNSLKSVSKTSDHEIPFGNSGLTAKTDFNLFVDSALSQTPVDFVEILSGFWLRPADIDHPRSFKSQQKSCSLDSLVSDGIGKENSTKSDSKYANRKPQPLILSSDSLKAETYLSQIIHPISKDSSDKKFRNASQETDLQSPTEIAKGIPTAWNSKPDVFMNQKSVSLAQKTSDADRSSFVLQPMTASLANVSAAHPITDAFSNFLNAALAQPMGFSVPCQPTLENSVHPITTASVDLITFDATPIAFSNADQRPMTTTANDVIDVSAQVQPSPLSSVPAATLPPSKENDLLHNEVSHETSSAIASAMHNLEKAIFMLNSFAMNAKTPVAPVTQLSTVATNTESLVKSFQSDGSRGTVPEVNNDTPTGKDHAAQVKERMLDEQSKTMESEFDIALKHLVLDVTEQPKNRIRQDAVLTITLNLLDQTLAEIHQEFPPGEAVETKSRSRSSATDLKEPYRSLQPPETTIPFWEIPWNTTSLQQGPYRQLSDQPFPTAMPLDPSASDQNRGIPEAEPQRAVDRQDSFNRPGSSLYGDPLPLPKVSVIRRHRRKKKNKNKSSTSPSSSTSSSSSAEEGSTEVGNSTSTTSGNGPKRSTRSIQRPSRRHRPAKPPEEGGASADYIIAVDDNTKSSCRVQRVEGNLEQNTKSVVVLPEESRGPGEDLPQTVITSSSHNQIDDRNPNGKTSIEGNELRKDTTLRGETRESNDVVVVSVKVPATVTGKQASINNNNNSNNNNNNNHDGASLTAGNPQSSLVGKDFRKTEEEEEEEEEEFHDSRSRLSSASLPLVSESSPTTAMHSPSFEQLRDCRSCSPPDGPASGQTQAANRCCPVQQPENNSTVSEEAIKKDIGSSLERLSFGSQDEVFLTPVNQPGKQVTVRNTKDGPDTAASLKESSRTIAVAHGCSSSRTDAADSGGRPSTMVRGGEAERGGVGGGSFTGCAQLTLKQKQDDETESSFFEVPAKGTAPHWLIQLSSRTTSSGDNDNDNNNDNRATTTVPMTIRAQSKAISYESICLRVQEDAPPPEVPKTIHILTSGQTSSHRAHCFRPALPEAKEEEEKGKEEEKKGEASSLHPKYPGKESANHLSVIASFSLERPVETKAVLQPEITSLAQGQMRARLPRSDADGRSNEKELPQTAAQRELIVQLNVLPGSAPDVKDNAQYVIRDHRLRQHTVPGPKDGGKQTAVSLTLADSGVVKRIARSKTLDENPKLGSELELAKSRLANAVAETPAMKVSKRKHLFEKESKPTINKFIMGTVFIDRKNKTQPDSSSGKTESLPSENSRRIEEKKLTETGRSTQQPLACTLHLVQSTVKSTNDEGNATKEETTTTVAATTATTTKTTATTNGSQERVARSATLPRIASAGCSEVEQRLPAAVSKVVAGRTPSQFLSTVSKFSQPVTTTSIVARLNNPVSRVSWAKQRFGDGPPANANPSANSVAVVTSQTFPGADRAKRADVTAKREQLLSSNVGRLVADRYPLLKKSNASIALECSGKNKKSTSEPTVVKIEPCSPPVSTRVILLTVSSKNEQASLQTVTESKGSLLSRQTEAKSTEINRSEDTGGVVGKTVHSSTKEDRLQDKRSLGLCVSVEKSRKGTSNADGKIDGSGKIKQLTIEDVASSGSNLSAAENIEATLHSKVEKPESVNYIPGVRAENDSSLSPLNRSSSGRFELSPPFHVSGSSSDVICPAVTSPQPPEPDIERLDSTSTNVNGSSIQNASTVNDVVVVYAEVTVPRIVNVSLNPILGKSVEEENERREGVVSSEQGQSVVQRKTTDSDQSSLLELEVKTSEQLKSLTDVNFQGKVSKCSILSEPPKQDPLSTEHDTKEEQDEQEPGHQEQEEDASSLVELSEDKPDEEVPRVSSHCSMEVICDDNVTAKSEIKPLVKKSEDPPSSEKNPNLNKGLESSSSSSCDRPTAVRFSDDQQSVRNDQRNNDDDGAVTASSPLESPASPTEKKGPAKPCIVRKQLIHLDSALHPSSCVPSEAKPVSSAKWSPKLVRKLNLADAQDVDVSDLSVDPQLIDFLSRQMDRAAAEKPDPAPHGDAGKEKTAAAVESARVTAAQGDAFAGQLSKVDSGEKSLSSKPASSTGTAKPEGEAEKRKFFSALKANAASFRAKLCAGGDEENRSQEKLHPLDRLTSFAIISDVGIGTKRRQFQNVINTTTTTGSSQSTTDPHPILTTSSSSTIEKRDPSKPGIIAPSHDDVTAKVDCTGTFPSASSKTPVESRTRLRKQKADDANDDDDDDFDRLVEINFRQLVEERAAGAGKDPWGRTGPSSKARTKVKASLSFNRSISTDRTASDRTKTSAAAAADDDDDNCLSLDTKMTNDSSSLDEKCKLLREKLKLGGESALKFHGSRRQMPRFKTQPVTFDEVEKAFEKALRRDDDDS